jgi:hypothetical protein
MNYRTENPHVGRHYDGATTNEARADWAESAIAHGCDAEAQRVDEPHVADCAYQDVKDLLSNLVHFCHRAGIEWEDVVDAAESAAEGDLEDGPEAKRDTERFPERSVGA